MAVWERGSHDKEGGPSVFPCEGTAPSGHGCQHLPALALLTLFGQPLHPQSSLTLSKQGSQARFPVSSGIPPDPTQGPVASSVLGRRHAGAAIPEPKSSGVKTKKQEKGAVEEGPSVTGGFGMGFPGAWSRSRPQRAWAAWLGRGAAGHHSCSTAVPQLLLASSPLRAQRQLSSAFTSSSPAPLLLSLPLEKGSMDRH